MNQILKIALVALIGMGFGLNAGIANTLVKGLGSHGVPATSLYLFIKGIETRIGESDLGLSETSVLGLLSLLLSGSKYAPVVGKHLDNYFGHGVLAALLINKIKPLKNLIFTNKENTNKQSSFLGYPCPANIWLGYDSGMPYIARTYIKFDQNLVDSIKTTIGVLGGMLVYKSLSKATGVTATQIFSTVVNYLKKK